MHSDTDEATPDIWTVTELNREVRIRLETGFGAIAVNGEISNLARPRSGHIYFSLKDSQAQLRCAWFRQRQGRSAPVVGDGDEVVVHGRISLYEPRGDYQLIVERIEAAGAGALQQRFEALKRKLAAEGLFDAEHKQDIPLLPRRIGVISSPSGAAVRDILNVLRRRFPAIPVRIYPVAVQGAAAPVEIVSALALAARRNDCDVLIVARGGGSLEDLWAFNEEVVARAIFECPIPVISGVGHETDTTIADFVADLRAPTPSGAAELAVPEQADWRARVQRLYLQLRREWQRLFEESQQRLDWLTRTLLAHSPAAELLRRRQRLRVAGLRMRAAALKSAARRRDRLASLHERLMRHSPERVLSLRHQRLEQLRGRLHERMRHALQSRIQRVAIVTRALNAVSPLSTLSRGYAVARRASDGSVLRSTTGVAIGDGITVELAEGRIAATVNGTNSDDDR